MTQGICIAPEEIEAAEVIARLDEISDRRGEAVPATGFDQLRHEIGKATTPATSAMGTA